MVKKALMGMVVGAGCLTLVVVQAQQGASKGTSNAGSLTAMDYVQIRQLVNRSAFAYDTGSNNGYDYADLFAPDGVYGGKTKGRDQLATIARGGKRGPLYVSHYVLNHIIEPTADGARGKQYVIEIDHDEDFPGAGNRSQWSLVGQKHGQLGQIGGHYDDVYTKTPVGWRFKSRVYTPAKSGADPTKEGTLKLVPPRPDPSDTVAANAASLSAMDYLEIERLVSSYGHALDSGYGTTENGEPYANLYTKDADFGGRTGFDALRDLGFAQPHGPTFVRHYLSNHVIEPFGMGAIGKQYLVVIDIPSAAERATGKPGSVYLGGHYEDMYVRTPDGWRIKTRKLFRSQAGATPTQSVAAAAPPSR